MSKNQPTRLLTRRRSDLEIARLVESMQGGYLLDRARLSEFDGLDRELLADVNSLLDALTHPLIIIAGCLGQMAHGEVPEKITEEFSGELEQMRNDLNACIRALGCSPGCPDVAVQETALQKR